MPLLAGVLTLLILGGVFLALLPSLMRPKPEPAYPFPSNIVADIHTHQLRARKALAEGKYPLAFKEVDAAKELSARHPQALSRHERFHLEQLHCQCDLLAHLLKVSLQEVVADAALAQEEEGHSVLFDDWLRADAEGRPMLHTYEVRRGGEPVRIALEDLRVLRQVPLDPPQRVLFGARLAKVNREPGGWVIRFDPDSGVLLTDLDAALCIPVDEDLRKVLERQQNWLLKSSGF